MGQLPVDDYEKFKKEKDAREKKNILEWTKDIFKKAKQGVLNPKEFIQNTEMYKSIHLKYLSLLEFIDDASFAVPALLMFVMLGGFLRRKLTDISGDVVDKAEKKILADKINELVDTANNMLAAIEEFDGSSLSIEETQKIRLFLKDSVKMLPPPDTLE